MSRIGKQLIQIPSAVKINLESQRILVNGPKGELTLNLPSFIKAEIKDNSLIIAVKNPSEKKQRALWGTYRNLIYNMVRGVIKGFEKKLEITGVGFKAVVSGNKLILNLGYSHPIEYNLPKGISATVEKNIITISGIDKQIVGQVASEIRALRKPEPYKGKGIKYIDEVIRRKAGKVAVKSE